MDSSMDPIAYQCTSFDLESMTWTSSGQAVIAFSLVDGSVIAQCGSTHLTDFSGILKPNKPKLNVIDPIRDAEKLSQVFAERNALPVTVILAFFGVFVLAWTSSVIADHRNKKTIESLREAHFMTFGEVKAGAEFERVCRFPFGAFSPRVIGVTVLLAVPSFTRHYGLKNKQKSTRK